MSDHGVRSSAGWLTVSAVTVGITNFLYALLLTWILPVHEYSQFATAQALLLVCGTAAAASIPWVLTHRVGSTSSPGALRHVVSFSVAVTAGQGIVAALVVAALAAGFSNSPVPWVAGLAAFNIFAAATVVGYLQGRHRFRRISLLTALEVALKVASGLFLIKVGAGLAGAVAGFAIGSAVVIAAGAPSLLRHFRAGLTALGDRRLWRQAIGLASIQGGVAVLASLDVVIGSLFSADTHALSGYQVSVILGRVPFFLSTAISTAAFARLVSHGNSAGPTMRTSIDVLGRSILPVGVALATMPLGIVQLFLPHAYPAVVYGFLPYTAAIGVLASLTNFLTTLFQAEQRFRQTITLLAAGIALDAAGIAVGLRLGGIHGLAVASVAGQAGTFAVLAVASWRVWRRAIMPDWSLLLVAVAALPLVLLRPAPAVWLLYAAAVCGVGGYTTFFGWPPLLGRLASLARLGSRAQPVEGADRAGGPAGRPSVFLLTSHAVSPPWNSGDKNLARTLLDGDPGVDYTFFASDTDRTVWPAGRSRVELPFGTAAPTAREKLRLFWWLIRRSPRVDLVHAVVTFQRNRFTRWALLTLRVLRHERLVITVPSGHHVPLPLLRRARAVVALSESTHKRLVKAGVTGVHRIPPGVDLDRFRPESNEEARRSLGLGPEPLLLFASHYDEGGGIDAALELIESLRRRVPEARLLIAMRHRPGYRDRRREKLVRRRIAERGLQDAVTDLGPTANMRAAIQACQAVIYQPLNLGMKMDLPMTLLEALAGGRPIVVSPVDTLGELSDGTPAVVVQEPGSAMILEHLERLLVDEGYAGRCAQAARRIAEQRFSAEAMSSAYGRLYRELQEEPVGVTSPGLREAPVWQ